jgi:threonyl-tRNA synthetase
MLDLGMRVEVDLSKEGLGKKVRSIKEMKYPYWIVIGDKDMDASKVTLESRDNGQLGQMTSDEVAAKLSHIIATKA